MAIYGGGKKIIAGWTERQQDVCFLLLHVIRTGGEVKGE